MAHAPPTSSFSFSVPAIDMSEDERVYKISAELPGIDAKDIDVSVSGDTPILKGEKRQEKEDKDKNYHFSSAPTARSNARFQLPSSVDRDEVAANLSKGVATITLPKTAPAQKPQKRIEIKSA
jgi:HSP20 family protein